MEELLFKIRETEAAIDSSKRRYELLQLPPYVGELEISSLQQRLQDLRRQMSEIEDVVNKEEIVVTLHPPGLPSGHIPVRTLSLVLGGLQSLTDSIANTIYNQPSRSGPIPQEILEKNSLILKEVKAGSFQAILDLNHESQLDFDEPEQTQIINELFGLFEASDDEEPLLETISNLGPRTLKYYADWTKSIKDLGTPVEINWRSAAKGYSNVSFDPTKAEKIFTVLNNKLETHELEVEVSGRLTGANVRTSTFEICLAEGTKITGRIAKDMVSTVASLLDKRCNAKLTKIITTYRSTGGEKISWTLNEIDQNDLE
jgi:hypothetical protein